MEQKDQRQEEIGDIVNAIRKINNLIQCYSRELMRNFQITGQQLGALKLIDRDPQISLSELSRQMYLHISTVSGIVDRLEAAGYLRRYRRTDDKRISIMELSEKGHRLIERAPVSGFGYMVQGLDKLPPAQLGEIRRSMAKILNLMKIEDNICNKPSDIIIKKENSGAKAGVLGKLKMKLSN